MGHIFPVMQDMIGFVDLGVVISWRSNFIEAGTVVETRRKFLDLVDNETIDRALRVAFQLNKLELSGGDTYPLGYYLNFGFSQDSKAQILINPQYYIFNKYARLIQDSRDIALSLKELNPTIKELEIKRNVMEKMSEVVNYDIPEWKPISEDEIKQATEVLSIWPEFYSSDYHGTFYRILDNLMALICFGHVQELHAQLTKEGFEIDKLINIVMTLSAKYYTQVQYNRYPLDEQATRYADENLPTDYLTRPNYYRKEYNEFRYEDTKQVHPTIPADDPFYYLSDIYDIKMTDGVPKVLQFRPDEYSLNVPLIPGTVIINGIEFKSNDLRLFYNTQLYDLVFSLIQTGQSNIQIPYISLKDLKLMRDLLQGRIMPQTFTDELSSQGIVFLGGDRTFYQLTESADTLSALNSIFSFGKDYVKQIRREGDSYEIRHVPRWNEFLEIVRSN